MKFLEVEQRVIKAILSAIRMNLGRYINQSHRIYQDLNRCLELCHRRAYRSLKKK
nr:MAG TPA: hypothetical protein [Caudoviricetes sp.]